MSTMSSEITGVSIVFSIVCSGADQIRYESSASLAFARGIHRWPVNSPHKGPVTRKMFPFDDVIMMKSWYGHTFHMTGHLCEKSTEFPTQRAIQRTGVFFVVKTAKLFEQTIEWSVNWDPFLYLHNVISMFECCVKHIALQSFDFCEHDCVPIFISVFCHSDMHSPNMLVWYIHYSDVTWAWRGGGGGGGLIRN